MANRSTLLRLPFHRQHNPRRVGSVTALDFDGQGLRVAQAVPRSNQAAVTRVAVAPLAWEAEADRTDPVALGQAIGRTLETLGIRAGSTVMGVPRQSVVLRTVAVPPIDNVREMASIVHLQIAKDLPFRLEEAVIDFKVRPAPTEAPEDGSSSGRNGSSGGDPADATVPAKLEVLVAAVKRETVEFYQKLATAAQIKLVALGWLSQANARCIEACRLGKSNQGVALVSLRPDEVGIDIVAGESLLFSRGAAIKVDQEPAVAAQKESDSAEPTALASTVPARSSYAEAVTIEAVRSIHSYGGMEVQAPVAQWAVTGVTGEEEVVVQALSDRLNTPCSRLDPGAALDLSQTDREQAAGAVGALGLALGVNDPEGLPFDFLNPKRPAVQRNMARIRTLALSAAGIALLFGVLGVRAHLINKRMKVNRQLQAELTEAEKKRPIYRRMQQQTAALDGWVKEGRNWLQQYAYLSAVLPGSEDLYITSLSISGQGIVHMAVQARSGEILANLDRQLRAAGYDVKPLAITPGNDKFGYNFRSNVELILPAKMKIDLSKVQPPARPADDGSLDSKSHPTRKGGRS